MLKVKQKPMKSAKLKTQTEDELEDLMQVSTNKAIKKQLNTCINISSRYVTHLLTENLSPMMGVSVIHRLLFSLFVHYI